MTKQSPEPSKGALRAATKYSEQYPTHRVKVYEFAQFIDRETGVADMAEALEDAIKMLNDGIENKTIGQFLDVFNRMNNALKKYKG